MPDPLLFALGALVTSIAAWAVWCIGQLEEDERRAEARAKSPDDGPR